MTVGLELKTQEKPLYVPMLRKANEWLYFDNLLAMTEAPPAVDCSSEYVVPADYNSARFNFYACDNAIASSLQVTSPTCIQGSSFISDITIDSSEFLAVPTAVVEYPAKISGNASCDTSSNPKKPTLTLLTDAGRAMIDLGFYVSTMARFQARANSATNPSGLEADDLFTGTVANFGVTLLGSDGQKIDGCHKTSTGETGPCVWEGNSEVPEQILVTLDQLLQASGIGEDLLQTENEDFKNYYESRNNWPAGGGGKYPLQVTGLELAVAVRWEQPENCQRQRYGFLGGLAGGSTCAEGSFPIIATLSVSQNPVFRPLVTSTSSTGAFSEIYGVRITTDGTGYILGADDIWNIYIPLIHTLVLISMLYYCMDTCKFCRCKSGRDLPFGSCCSNTLICIEDMRSCKDTFNPCCGCCGSFYEKCCKYADPQACCVASSKMLREKPRIRHIRRKFQLQYNFHEAEDKLLDETQVLLHSVIFRPNQTFEEAGRGNIPRVKLHSLLASLDTERSMLKRLVKKELQTTLDSTRLGQDSNTDMSRYGQILEDVHIRTEVLNLLLTSGASVNDVNQNISEDFEPEMDTHIHGNLFRAMFLEFNETLSKHLGKRKGVNYSQIRRQVKPHREPPATKITPRAKKPTKLRKAQTTRKEPAEQGLLYGDLLSSTDEDSSSNSSGNEHTGNDGMQSQFSLQLQNVGFDFSSGSDSSDDDGQP